MAPHAEAVGVEAVRHLLILAAALGLGVWRGWTQPPPASCLTFLAVGQGDCVVLQHAGHTLLVDAAPATDTFDAGRRIARPGLEALGVETLDLVLITHPDADHIGGLPSLARVFAIGCVVASDRFRDHPDLLRVLGEAGIDPEEVLWLSGPTRIAFDGLVARVDPPRITPGTEDNQGSLFIHLTNGYASATLSGDAGVQTEAIELASGQDWRAQLLMAGHHGSSTSSSDAWLDAVGASEAVISCGRDNRYGHPHPQVLARLRAKSRHVYQTALEGTIRFSFTKRGAQLLR